MIRARNLILTGHMYSFEIEFKSRTNVNAENVCQDNWTVVRQFFFAPFFFLQYFI